ncbi:MAG: 50S ribosomal protein L25/general stress protein Ctc [Desulfobacteraceae bacterium]|nr:50S ribosomal protein L25/general stress protein Ctc [Desulfobacteraceae bacterium]
MEIHRIEAQPRHSTGKGTARALRREGRIPAVLYGSDMDSVNLSLGTHSVDLLLNRINYAQTLLNLVVAGDAPIDKTVMIKEIQAEPLSQNLRHVDFYEIDMKRKLTVTVPIVITGVAKGIEDGGVLQIVRRELDVNCLPDAIPENVTVDVTNLEIGDSIHVNELKLDGAGEIPHDVNFTIVTIVSPKRAEAEGKPAEGAEEAPTEAAAAPEK